MSYNIFIEVVWMVIMFIITFLIIGLIILIRMKSIVEDSNIPYKYFNPDDFATGDILIVFYGGIGSLITRSFIGTKWLHPAIYYLDPDDHLPYILEGSFYSRGNYDNFFKIPFMDWYRINRYGSIAHIHLNKPINPYRLMKTYSQFIENATLDSFSVNWYRFLYKSPYRKINYSRKFTCVESVIRTLQECDVIKKKYSESSYFSDDFFNGNIEFEEGYYIKNITRLCPGRAYVRAQIP
jgi:hypothetical protein